MRSEGGWEAAYNFKYISQGYLIIGIHTNSNRNKILLMCYGMWALGSNSCSPYYRRGGLAS